MTVLIGCQPAREAISSRFDREELPVSAALLDAHLVECHSCREYQADLEALNRRLRVRKASAVPDFTAQILAATVFGPPQEPSRRRRRLRAGAIAAAITLFAGLTGAVLGDRIARSDHIAAHLALGAGVSQINPRYPGAVVLPRTVAKPSVVLVDTSGQPFDFAAATTGRVTLVYFGYTHCPDVCPINMALAAGAIAQLSAAQRLHIAVVFVTTDPSRDTRYVIRHWLNRFDSSFIGLTGTLAQVDQAERQVAMPMSYNEVTPRSDDQVVHAGYTLVYSSNGSAYLQVDATETSTNFATTLRHLLAYGFRPA